MERGCSSVTVVAGCREGPSTVSAMSSQSPSVSRAGRLNRLLAALLVAPLPLTAFMECTLNKTGTKVNPVCSVDLAPIPP